MLQSGALENEEYLPSAYGSWLVRLGNAHVKGLKKLQSPSVVGKIYLQAAVDLCSGEKFEDDILSQHTSSRSYRYARHKLKPIRSFHPGSGVVSRSVPRTDQDYCCKDRGKHWSVTRRECQSCPAGSVPSYDSYFCEDKVNVSRVSPSLTSKRISGELNQEQKAKAKALHCQFLEYVVPSLAEAYCH